MRGDVLLTPCPLASLLPLGSLGGGLGGSLWSGLLGWSCPWLEPAAPMVWSGHHPDVRRLPVSTTSEKDAEVYFVWMKMVSFILGK